MEAVIVEPVDFSHAHLPVHEQFDLFFYVNETGCMNRDKIEVVRRRRSTLCTSMPFPGKLMQK